MEKKQAKLPERAERLAAALRANLRKRKAQARQRAADDQEETAERDRPDDES